jgi:hypothetical protein
MLAADDQAYRIQHPVDGEVPDRIALRWMARIAAEKHDFAVVLVMSHTSDDTVAANRLVTYLAELHESLISERRDAEARIACYPDRSQPTEEEAYRLLDLVNDVRAVVDEKYRVIAEADLGAERLRPLLDDLILGISASVIRSKDAYKGALPSAITNNLLAFCEARG